MRLRTKAIVMRYHLSKNKEGHEEYYSEMQLFYPWRDEVEDLQRYDDEECLKKYDSVKEEITLVKSQIFPGEKALEIYDFDRIEQCRPQHVYDTLNCQGEQANEDDLDLEVEEDLQIAPLPWNGPDEEHVCLGESSRSKAKYRQIENMSRHDLMQLTLKLVPEQKEVLTEMINFCKSVVKGRTKFDQPVQQPLKLVHGRAGKSTIISLLAIHTIIFLY